MKYIYPYRYKFFGGYKLLLGDVCQKVDIPLGVHMAYCPDDKWG